MIPPTVGGSSITDGVLHENLIKLSGNGFQYLVGSHPPVVSQVESGEKAVIAWFYRYEVHHPPAGMTGGEAPSFMDLWIKELVPGARYRLEFYDHREEFTVADEIRYVQPEHGATYPTEKPPAWYRRILKRLRG